MEERFITTATLDFTVAFGVVLGGTLLGGLAAFLLDTQPMYRMLKISDQLKIWAMVAAIGGTIDRIKSLEITILGGQLYQAFQQIVCILCAFMGAQLGTLVISWLIQEEG